ncbi:MAG: OmpH family outer membrane protein [Acidobacteria bacterium]|nr:OmpH family outer membrane protein [Acidobacteriota bacterium]
MRRISLLAVSVIIAGVLVGAAFGQGSAPAAQPGTNLKIVVINTAAFDAKDGIVKYTNAMSALEKEFTPAQTEINTLVTNYQKMGADIKTQQDNLNGGKVPVDRNALASKIEEYQTLELTIKRKQEDGKRKFELRQQQIMSPILQDIGKAIDDYAKQKGYSLILDAAKMDNAGIILAVDVSKLDVTKDFITFYNARPAGTATTAVPK